MARRHGGSQGMLLTGGGGPARVSNLRGVQTPMDLAWHTRGGEGRIKVLPWYRLVGLVSTSSETPGGKTVLPARVSGRRVQRG